MWLRVSANPVGGAEGRKCGFEFGAGDVRVTEVCLDLEKKEALF